MRGIIDFIVILVVGVVAIFACQAVFAQQDLQGWVDVPGGTVWLRPGEDAYEHSTGLVRDLRTGRKSYAVTPQSVQMQGVPTRAPALPAIANCNNGGCYSPQSSPGSIVIKPRVAPQTLAPSRLPATSYMPNPYYSPFTPTQRPNANSSRYDFGPYGPYGSAGFNYGLEPTSNSLRSEFGTLRNF